RNNATLNNLKVTFKQVDIFETFELHEKWDIIVSNPPYVPNSEKADIQPNVLNYEPHLALFVSDSEPLIFYKRIADFALNHLNSKGKLYFEIHRDAGNDCINLLINSGFKNIELKKDLFGNDRMVRAEI
ncbi:MAG TPA: protein-(glutamine-N5) methyltransferase, release factor-specific, partial [Paludibacter sp.]|nr:protein-(glutamine-N5) methyltransferase, release factor-specific [Paludibacter sp.]